MGCMNIVIYLLQHGASADVPTVRGETPLHLAARANQTDIIRILLRNGAQVDARARVSVEMEYCIRTNVYSNSDSDKNMACFFLKVKHNICFIEGYMFC